MTERQADRNAERERERARLVHIEDQEACEPERWVWLTFRTEAGGALGVVIVRGRGAVSAAREAQRLNCLLSEHFSATMLPRWVMPSPLTVEHLLDRTTAKRLAAAWEVPLSLDGWPTNG